MKRIIRKIVNWAYGIEFSILLQATENLASTVADLANRMSMEINSLKQQMKSDQKSSQR